MEFLKSIYSKKSRPNLGAMHLDYSKALYTNRTRSPSRPAQQELTWVFPMSLCLWGAGHTPLTSLFLTASEQVHPGEWFGGRRVEHTLLFSGVDSASLFLRFLPISFAETFLPCQVGASGANRVAGSQSVCSPCPGGCLTLTFNV